MARGWGKSREGGAMAVDIKKIEACVIILASEHSGRRRKDVSKRAKLMDDLGMDELDTLEFEMSLEDEYGFEIPNDNWADDITVQGVIDYVVKRLEE